MTESADYERVAQIAARLSVSPQTVRRHLALGNLAGLDIGTSSRKFYRVAPASLAAFEQARAARTPETPRE